MVAVAWPLAGALLVACVLAATLFPAQRRLTKLLGGRPRLAAGVLVMAVFLLVIGPLAAMSAFAINEASAGAAYLLETVRGEGVYGLLQRLPAPIDRWAIDLLARIGDLDAFVQRHLGSQGGTAASAVGAALLATGAFLFQSAMMLVALFFFLVGGKDLIGWIDEASPLRPGQTRELMEEFGKVSYAIIVATVISAAAQAVAALVGYLIASVPHALFFTGLTFFVALVPVGAASVCVFAAFLLLATGHPYMAIFLAVWGMAVVGMVDNIVKPFVMKGDMELNAAVLFFALIGGIAAFGMVGLILAPLALAFFLACLRIWRRDFLQPRD